MYIKLSNFASLAVLASLLVASPLGTIAQLDHPIDDATQAYITGLLDQVAARHNAELRRLEERLTNSYSKRITDLEETLLGQKETGSDTDKSKSRLRGQKSGPRKASARTLVQGKGPKGTTPTETQAPEPKTQNSPDDPSDSQTVAPQNPKVGGGGSSSSKGGPGGPGGPGDPRAPGDSKDEEDIALLQEEVASLKDTVDTLVSSLDGLSANLACVSGSSTDKDLIFEGCNVHVVNGLGATDSITGTGNLIVGYNEETECLRNNEGACAHSGSHNIIAGHSNTFTSYGGIVVGTQNSITGPYAAVTGGVRNTASGASSSVSGGQGNLAGGPASSVSGGDLSRSMGQSSNVSGGSFNAATAAYSTVSGGKYQLSD